MVGAVGFVRRWGVLGRVLQQLLPQMCGAALLFLLLLLLFSHTGCMLFSGSVEGFRTTWQTSVSLLGLPRGRVVHRLCKQHPVLGPLYCLSSFAAGFWLLARLCGAALVHTYRTLKTEMHRPSLEPQDYEMVEFLIKRLKLWMGLSKAKEFRHRVKFEGMESPPSRSSQCSQFSSLSVSNSPSPVSASSPAGPRLVSSASSEISAHSDGPDLQQYLQRLLPSVEELLTGLDRVTTLTEDVLDMELQLQEVRSRMAEKRKKPDPQTSRDLPEDPLPDRPPQTPGLEPHPPRRRGTHSESSLLGLIHHPPSHPGEAWHQGPAIPSRTRRRAWHSGSCHSASLSQRFSRPQNHEGVPPRPRSEEGDRSEGAEALPVKRRAWHPEDSEMETDQGCTVDSAETEFSSIN